MTETRRRYDLRFGLLLNSGLRIGEALALKASDVRLMAGTAKSVRVVGKGDKERLVPLPGAFGAVFGFWFAYSTGNWTGIPRETGHPFQAKLDRDSTGNWTPEVAKRRAG